MHACRVPPAPSSYSSVVRDPSQCAGCLPPFGHLLSIPVIVDEGLRDAAFSSGRQGPHSDERGGEGNRFLACGVGMSRALLCITFEQLLQLTGGKLHDIAEDSGGSATGVSALGSIAVDCGSPARLEEGSVANEEQDGAEVRLLLDTMLGRLCRWLRCLGVDASIVDQRLPRDRMLDRVAQVRHKGGMLPL